MTVFAIGNFKLQAEARGAFVAQSESPQALGLRFSYLHAGYALGLIQVSILTTKASDTVSEHTDLLSVAHQAANPEGVCVTNPLSLSLSGVLSPVQLKR